MAEAKINEFKAKITEETNEKISEIVRSLSRHLDFESTKIISDFVSKASDAIIYDLGSKKIVKVRDRAKSEEVKEAKKSSEKKGRRQVWTEEKRREFIDYYMAEGAREASAKYGLKGKSTAEVYYYRFMHLLGMKI